MSDEESSETLKTLITKMDLLLPEEKNYYFLRQKKDNIGRYLTTGGIFNEEKFYIGLPEGYSFLPKTPERMDLPADVRSLFHAGYTPPITDTVIKVPVRNNTGHEVNVLCFLWTS